MKLWLIQQDEANGYDTYDSAVVAAETAEDAAMIHPGSYTVWPDGSGPGSWCSTPDKVRVSLLGEAVHGTERGVVLASFNAG